VILRLAKGGSVGSSRRRTCLVENSRQGGQAGFPEALVAYCRTRIIRRTSRSKASSATRFDSEGVQGLHRAQVPQIVAAFVLKFRVSG
jgi:hypothetical protein